MAFNPKGKTTWDVEVRIVLTNGNGCDSSWTVVASSAPTAFQRAIKSAARHMKKNDVKGRSSIRYVNARGRENHKESEKALGSEKENSAL